MFSKMLGEKPTSAVCSAIDGIIVKPEDFTGEVQDKAVLDSAIVAAGQAVAHYEIPRYRSLVAWSKLLRRSNVASLLDRSSYEEMAAAQKLARLPSRRTCRRRA
jgi:ferritin-like metal-binding protein YciE